MSNEELVVTIAGDGASTHVLIPLLAATGATRSLAWTCRRTQLH